MGVNVGGCVQVCKRVWVCAWAWVWEGEGEVEGEGVWAMVC